MQANKTHIQEVIDTLIEYAEPLTIIDALITSCKAARVRCIHQDNGVSIRSLQYELLAQTFQSARNKCVLNDLEQGKTYPVVKE